MMKTAFYFCLIFAQVSFGQSLNFFSQPFPSFEISNVFISPNHNIWYAGKSCTLSGTVMQVGCVDSNFNEIYRSPVISFGDISFITGIKSLGDSIVLIGVNGVDCDLPPLSGTIVRLNLKSNKFNFENNFRMKWVAFTEENQIIGLSTSNQAIYYYDEKSRSISNDSILIGSWYFSNSGKIWSAQGQYFIEDDLNNLVVIDSTGNSGLKLSAPIGKYATFENIQIIEKNRIYAYTSGNYLYYSNFKNQVHKYFITQTNDPFTGLTYDSFSQKLFVGSAHYIRTYDKDFNLIETRDFSEREVAPVGFFSFLDKKYFYGKTVPFSKRISNKIGYEVKTGIGCILPVEKDKMETEAILEKVEFQFSPPRIEVLQFSQTRYDLDFGDVSFTLKNNGTDTIHNITINSSHEQLNFICLGDAQYFWTINSLNIAPNEGKLVTIKNIKLSNFAQIKRNGICFWISLVNGKADKYDDNNYSCTEFSFIASIDFSETNNISISPNPTSGNIHIASTDENIKHITICDAIGKIVYSQKVGNQSAADLDLSFLQSGFYSARVDTDGSSSIKKIIVRD